MVTVTFLTEGEARAARDAALEGLGLSLEEWRRLSDSACCDGCLTGDLGGWDDRETYGLIQDAGNYDFLLGGDD